MSGGRCRQGSLTSGAQRQADALGGLLLVGGLRCFVRGALGAPRLCGLLALAGLHTLKQRGWG